MRAAASKVVSPDEEGRPGTDSSIARPPTRHHRFKEEAKSSTYFKPESRRIFGEEYNQFGIVLSPMIRVRNTLHGPLPSRLIA
jgi:hypothetical protein